MKTLEQQLSQYASYHLDKRNIASHFVGIPLILLAVVMLLSRPRLEMWGLAFSPAIVASAIAAVYYIRLDRVIGMVMLGVLLICLGLGAWAAGKTTHFWLSASVGGFVLGWIIQFVGHIWERRKPAFVDDIVGLVIGPLFIVAEAMFYAGWRPALRRQVEQNARLLKGAN